MISMGLVISPSLKGDKVKFTLQSFFLRFLPQTITFLKFFQIV